MVEQDLGGKYSFTQQRRKENHSRRLISMMGDYVAQSLLKMFSETWGIDCSQTSVLYACVGGMRWGTGGTKNEAEKLFQIFIYFFPYYC